MRITISILIFFARRFSDEQALVTGAYYYDSLNLPSTRDQKKKSLNDFIAKENMAITITGSFQQICDLIMFSDKFNRGGPSEIQQFGKVLDGLAIAGDRPVLFDDSTNMKGTSLALHLIIDVEEDEESIDSKLSSRKNVIELTLTPNWSIKDDIINAMKGS